MSRKLTAAELTDAHWATLWSFTTGPKIWDAVDVFNRVVDLAGAGLLRAVDESGRAYELTPAGSRALIDRVPTS